MSPDSSTATGMPVADHAIRRSIPRTAQEGIAFVHPLHANAGSNFRVELVDLNCGGAGVRILIPIPKDAAVVLSISHHPLMKGMFRCRVAHCTKLANGRYYVGLCILERCDGNLNTTRIPDAWRRGP